MNYPDKSNLMVHYLPMHDEDRHIALALSNYIRIHAYANNYDPKLWLEDSDGQLVIVVDKGNSVLLSDEQSWLIKQLEDYRVQLIETLCKEVETI